MDFGEYRYINNIDISLDDMLEIENKKEIKEEYKLDINNYNLESQKLEGTLIPVGGGKDSCVTLELLKESIDNNLCLIVGNKEPSIKSAELAGYKNKIIFVKRTIDKNLLDLNKRGFLNGHTPFSALLAFLSYTIAYLTCKKYITLSNESSANESTVIGQ